MSLHRRVTRDVLRALDASMDWLLLRGIPTTLKEVHKTHSPFTQSHSACYQSSGVIHGGLSHNPAISFSHYPSEHPKLLYSPQKTLPRVFFSSAAPAGCRCGTTGSWGPGPPWQHSAAAGAAPPPPAARWGSAQSLVLPATAEGANLQGSRTKLVLPPQGQQTTPFSIISTAPFSLGSGETLGAMPMIVKATPKPCLWLPKPDPRPFLTKVQSTF